MNILLDDRNNEKNASLLPTIDVLNTNIIEEIQQRMKGLIQQSLANIGQACASISGDSDIVQSNSELNKAIEDDAISVASTYFSESNLEALERVETLGTSGKNDASKVENASGEVAAQGDEVPAEKVIPPRKRSLSDEESTSSLIVSCSQPPVKRQKNDIPDRPSSALGPVGNSQQREELTTSGRSHSEPCTSGYTPNPHDVRNSSQPQALVPAPALRSQESTGVNSLSGNSTHYSNYQDELNIGAPKFTTQPTQVTLMSLRMHRNSSTETNLARTDSNSSIISLQGNASAQKLSFPVSSNIKYSAIIEMENVKIAVNKFDPVDFTTQYHFLSRFSRTYGLNEQFRRTIYTTRATG